MFGFDQKKSIEATTNHTHRHRLQTLYQTQEKMYSCAVSIFLPAAAAPGKRLPLATWPYLYYVLVTLRGKRGARYVTATAVPPKDRT
jgi:hypothetical protein